MAGISVPEMRQIARGQLTTYGLNPDDPTIVAILEAVFDVIVANNSEINVSEAEIVNTASENFKRLVERLRIVEQRLSINP